MSEREELKQLRKDNARLEMEVEILGKATAYSMGHRNTTTSDRWLKDVVTHAGSQTRLGRKRES
jgi:transposase-like protein